MKLALTIIALSSLILSIEAFEAFLGRVDFQDLLRQLHERCVPFIDSPPSWTDDVLQGHVNEQLAELAKKGTKTVKFKLLGGKLLDCTIVKHTDDV